VGQWKISSVSKGFVKADPMNHSRKPVVGLKAVIQK